MRIIQNTLFTICGLGLAGCCSTPERTSNQAADVTGQYDFTSAYTACIPNRGDDVSQSEQEHDCAYAQYKERKEELQELYQEVLNLCQARVKQESSGIQQSQLENLIDSQENFRKFLKHNAQLSNAAYTNNYPYNYYGTMTDYINVRMRHLSNLKREIQ